MPLTSRDKEALDNIFEELAVEEISDIEAHTAGYSIIPLEPWEEIGWVINSTFQSPCDSIA